MNTVAKPITPIKSSGLMEAFIRAQKEIQPNPVFDMEANTGKFKYPYLSLGKVLFIVREACAKQDIAIQQFNEKKDGDFLVVTRLTHISGEAQDYYTPMFGITTSPQDFGKSYTYSRRYAFYGIFGIYGEEDDDSNGLSLTKAAPSRPPAESPDAKKRALLGQIVKLIGSNDKLKTQVLKHYNATDFSVLSVQQMEDCLDRLPPLENKDAN